MKKMLALVSMPFLIITGICHADASSQKAKENGTLTVGIVDNYLPCSDAGASGSYSGFSVDIWREVQEKLITKSYKFVNIETFEKAIESASDGTVDLIASCHTITPNRLEKVNFSVPYVSDSVGIISRKTKANYINNIWLLIANPTISLSLLSLFLITGTTAIVTTLSKKNHSDQNESGYLHEIFKKWILLFLGQGAESILWKGSRDVLLVLVAGCAQIFLVAVLVSELTALNLQSAKISNLEGIRTFSFNKLINEGLAAVDGTETQRRLLNKIRQDKKYNREIIDYLYFPTTLSQMIDELASEKYNHIIAPDTVLEYILANTIDSSRYEITIVSNFKTPKGFVFGKNLKQEDRLIINKAISEMNYNGSVYKILERYK